MFRILLGIIVLIGLVNTPANANNSLWKTTSGDKLMIQELDQNRVLYCWNTGGRGIDCVPIDSTREEDSIRFEKLPYLYELVSGSVLKRKNKFTDKESELSIANVTQPISAAKYSGAWANVNATEYQIISYDADRNRGVLNYKFLDSKSTHNFTAYGSTIVVERDEDFNLYFIQLGDQTIGNFKSKNNGTGRVTMTAEAFLFKNDAVCAQSYLNYLGFPVGKADGQPGAKSIKGSQAFLNENPELKLEVLTKKTAQTWCELLKTKTDSLESVVALAGL